MNLHYSNVGENDENNTATVGAGGLELEFQAMDLTDASTTNHHDNVRNLPALILYPENVKGATDGTGKESSCTSRAKEVPQDYRMFLADEDGDTALHISIMQEDEVNAANIISLAPDFVCLEIPNNMGQTPAHLAAITNMSKIMRRLMCAGADISGQDKHGNTPLHTACIYDNLEIVKQLLRPINYTETLENKYETPFRAIPQNMNVKNVDGLTCLHLSVLYGNVDIVRLLLEVEADSNFGDSKSGRTALHMAAEQGMWDTVALLLSYPKTSVDAQNYAGYTPAQLAYSRGHHEITELLVRQGATFGFYFDQDEDEDEDEDTIIECLE